MKLIVGPLEYRVFY